MHDISRLKDKQMPQYYTQINANPHFSLRFVSSLIKQAIRDKTYYEAVDGMELGDITYSVGFDPEKRELTLRWRERGREHRQRIGITSKPCNIRSLSEAVVYYFLCPETQTKCRVLYKMIGGGFCGRKALPKALYPLQMKSHINRYLHYPPDSKEPYRRNGKEHYRGKLTPYGRRCQRWEAAKDRQDETFYNCIKKTIRI